MKTYKELRDGLFEEVSKIAVSKLPLGYGGLESYTDLLKKMAELPGEAYADKLKDMCCGFGSASTPKVEE